MDDNNLKLFYQNGIVTKTFEWGCIPRPTLQYENFHNPPPPHQSQNANFGGFHGVAEVANNVFEFVVNEI